MGNLFGRYSLLTMLAITCAAASVVHAQTAGGQCPADPISLKTTEPLSDNTVLRTYGCVYGCPLADDDPNPEATCAPPGGPGDGVKMEIVTGGRVVLSHRASMIHVVEGPTHAKTWPFGPKGQAILVADTGADRTGFVPGDPAFFAIYDGVEWKAPPDDFSVEATSASGGTITFLRDTVCVPPLRCVPVPWEASGSGVVPLFSMRNWFAGRRDSLKRWFAGGQRYPNDRPDCALGLIQEATRLYVYSRALGDSQDVALSAFDKSLARRNTSGCTASDLTKWDSKRRPQTGPAPSIDALRADLVKSTAAFLPNAPPSQRSGK